MIRKLNIVRWVLLLALLAASCSLRDGCSRAPSDLAEVMPRGPAALVLIDVKALRGDGTGKRIIEALVKEDDTLRPMLTERVDRIAVAMAGDPGAWAYGVFECPSCDLELVASCLAADFGISFNLERSSVIEHGKARLYPSDTDPPMVLGKAGGIFVLGPEKHARRVVDVIEGREKSLAGSQAYVELRKNLSAPADASLLVFDSKAFRKQTFGPENELARDLMEFQRAVLGLKLGGGAMEIAGRMLYDGKEGEAARSAERIRKTLAGFALNPILKQLGLAFYLEKIKIGQAGGRGLSLSFSATESEIFELMERKDQIFTLGL